MKQAGTTTYLVNGLGQRVKKATGVVETFFAYDEAGHLIGEYDTTGAAIQETVWLGDLPVAVMKPATPTAVFYVWSDNLGTPRMITNAANQARWEWANSDTFGNNLPNENPAGLGIFTYNLRFPGQYYDGETGKHYNYFRDYDALLGRYLRADPLGLQGGLNIYAYVSSSPLLNIDPYGDTGVLAGGRVGASIGAAIGSIFPGPGTAMGAAVGFGVGAAGAYLICRYLDEKDKELCRKNYENDLDRCDDKYGNGLKGEGFRSAWRGCRDHAARRLASCLKGESDPGPWSDGHGGNGPLPPRGGR